MEAIIRRESRVVRSARVRQLEGMFDLPPTQTSALTWRVRLPIEEREWHIGLIVGPSGCGKSTVARTLFPQQLVEEFAWPADRSLVDGFPESLSMKEVVALLSSVGLSSPPAWLRPYAVLSNGEKFRVTLARGLAEFPERVVFDEFTSVVDRTVARIGSAAVARTIRQRRSQFVAVSCHCDILDWLQPDWVYEPATDTFQWRSLRRRPELALEVVRVHSTAWRLFAGHHYLSQSLHPAATCFVGLVEGTPACLTAVLPFPHPHTPGWREHRTVCLPDYQGVGLGNGLSEYVASLFAATGRPYTSITSHPAMIGHRHRSPLWHMTRRPSVQASGHRRLATKRRRRSGSAPGPAPRMTASFVYVGPTNPDEARYFGIAIPASRK